MTDGEACTVLLRSFFPALNMDSGSYLDGAACLSDPSTEESPRLQVYVSVGISLTGGKPTNRQQLVFRLPHLRDKTYIQLIGMRSLR
jgi:hypothetical protein